MSVRSCIPLPVTETEDERPYDNSLRLGFTRRTAGSLAAVRGHGDGDQEVLPRREVVTPLFSSGRRRCCGLG